MTVTYTLKVSNAALCGFAKLLLRWKGSIYKLLYREMIIFILLYYGLSGLYRYVLGEDRRRAFEKIVLYCEAFTDLIPLSFVLGFYVSIVVGRWWQQYMCIPWPDRVVTVIGSHIIGQDERSRLIRRTLARYLNLMAVVTCQNISTSVKKRFPTIDHIVDAADSHSKSLPFQGLMTQEEKHQYEELVSTNGKWWVPAQWFSSLVVQARMEGRIRDDILLKQLLDEMLSFRGCCGMLFSYDWISIPLVYTQVVTIAIYTFFLATLMGRQYLDPKLGYKGHEVDLYIPVFTILQFFFYMGWLKVAEQLINPFGEDDDDFDLNWVIDRNMQVSFLIVDEMHMKHPPMVKDVFWDELEPQLPYTKSSISFKTEPHLGSTADLNINLNQSLFVPMNTIQEEDSFKHQYDQTIVNLQTNPQNETSPKDYYPFNGRESMLSLHSMSTLKQDLQNSSFTDSNFDSESQKYNQKFTSGTSSPFYQSLLASDGETNQTKEISNLLMPSHSLSTDHTPFHFQQHLPLHNSAPFEATDISHYSNSLLQNQLSQASITGNDKATLNPMSTNSSENVFVIDNHPNVIDNFSNEFRIQEPFHLLNPDNAMCFSSANIETIKCENSVAIADGFQFQNVRNALQSIIDSPESDSNQSTVSSVAELLTHADQ